MASPVDQINATSQQASQFSYLSARQRVERVLAQLPVSDGVEQHTREQAAGLTHEQLVEPVRQVNEVLRSYGVEFDLSDDSGRTIIKLVDRENGEVLRQIPPEEALNAAQRLEEVKGRLLRLEV